MNSSTNPHTPTSYTSNSPHCRHITNQGQLDQYGIILDPNHSSFYYQFSNYSNPEDLVAALKALKKMSTLQLATLHFLAGCCHEFHTLIIENMRKVFSSDDPKEKGVVFIHLIKSIHKIQNESEFTNHIYQNLGDIKETVLLLGRLKRYADEMNLSGFFKGMDMREQYLSKLDIKALRLKFTLDLSKSIFDAACMVHVNFGDTVLDGATFNNLNELSTITGDHLKNDILSMHAEIQDSGSIVEREHRNKKCLIS